ncbi:hypothetical protein D3C84_871500 [compost metagenome]
MVRTSASVLLSTASKLREHHDGNAILQSLSLQILKERSQPFIYLCQHLRMLLFLVGVIIKSTHFYIK